jgi:hypothetical protein
LLLVARLTGRTPSFLSFSRAPLPRQAPSLLDDLFNGLLWTSKSASTTEEGIIRVNYYVRLP